MARTGFQAVWLRGGLHSIDVCEHGQPATGQWTQQAVSMGRSTQLELSFDSREGVLHPRKTMCLLTTFLRTAVMGKYKGHAAALHVLTKFDCGMQHSCGCCM